MAHRLHLQTRERCQLVDVTREVAEAVRQAGLSRGAVVVQCPHTTAGVTVQENADPDVQRDLLLALENLVPREAQRGRYRHAEGNADAHVKASLVGSSATVPVEGSELLLGTWQALYLCEFDGPRRRELVLTFLEGR